MTTTKRKPARRGRKSSPPGRAPRAGSRSPALAELPLQQGLVEMATIGAQSFLWLAMLVVIVAGLAGAAFGIWSLRPLPAYWSERVRSGSPFAATFRVQNASAWFPLSHLRIRCVLSGVDAPDMPPVDADTSRIPARIEPGTHATFTCPFQAADLDVALRSELYFLSEYDLPVLGSFRITDNQGPFALDTRALPPRWTAKPAKD
jgi:hypothetical protein